MRKEENNEQQIVKSKKRQKKQKNKDKLERKVIRETRRIQKATSSRKREAEKS